VHPEKKPINCYEAVRITYHISRSLREYLGYNLKDNEINKELYSIWRFIYQITKDEEINKNKEGLRINVKIVNRDPNNLLVCVCD
jgi:hypothetical protein